MGPPELKPAPPALEWTLVPPEHRFVSKRLQECNYLQAIEGGIDSSHVSFLHSGGSSSDPLHVGKGAELQRARPMPHFDVVEIDGGLLIGARRQADDGRYYWRITPWIMPWYTLIPPCGGNRSTATPGCRSTTRIAGLVHQLSSDARADRRRAEGDGTARAST